MILQLARRFHTSITFHAEGSLLAKLRKKTGYTIANCKKALEMHNNDADKVINTFISMNITIGSQYLFKLFLFWNYSYKK